jgi:hypothetical protein
LGNHDVRDSAVNSFNLLRDLPEAGALTNVTFIEHRRQVRFGGVDVLALPWGSKPPDRFVADLVVFHAPVIGAKVDNGQPVRLGQGWHPSRLKGYIAVGGDLVCRRSGAVQVRRELAQANSVPG